MSEAGPCASGFPIVFSEVYGCACASLAGQLPWLALEICSLALEQVP